MLAIWSRDCNGSAAKRLFTDNSSPKLTDRFRRIALKKSADVRCSVARWAQRSRGRGLSCRFRHRAWDQLCQFAEVLGGGCEVELIAGTVWSS